MFLLLLQAESFTLLLSIERYYSSRAFISFLCLYNDYVRNPTQTLYLLYLCASLLSISITLSALLAQTPKLTFLSCKHAGL